MLIIFDLDDTLIDTTGSIIPLVLKNAVGAMEKAGLVLAQKEEAINQLLRLNSHHLTSQDALKEFIQIIDAPQTIFEAGKKAIYEAPTLPKTILPLDDAIEILDELKEEHLLGLVTKGNEAIQREKMERAGIDPKIFSYLFCTKTGNKKKCYEMIGEQSGISPENTLVCGDRISLDLTPAKELGHSTVQIRWGRGLGNTGLKKDVDYTILHLRELKGILSKLKN